MRHSCIVCKGEVSPAMSYFSFPMDVHRKAEWCKNLGLDSGAVTSKSSKHKVCQNHFTSIQFINKQRTQLRRDAVPIPSKLIVPSSPATAVYTLPPPQLQYQPIIPQSLTLLSTTSRFTPIQPRISTQPTPTQIPGPSRSEPIVIPAPVSSNFTSVPGIFPSSTLQWVLVPKESLRQVLETTSVELDSRRNDGMNRKETESVAIPVEKTTNPRRTLSNVLNWIRKVYGNQLPEEVVQLLNPIVLTEPEPQGKSSVQIDDSSDEIKEEVKSEHSSSVPGSPTHSLEDSYLQSSSAQEQLVGILGQENELRPPVSHNCPYCNQAFYSMVELSKHSLLHCSLPLSRVREKSVPLSSTKKCLRNLSTGIKMAPKGRVGVRINYPTHPCPKCNEKFTNLEKLWQHIRKNHPGHRMFKCDICEKGFYTPSACVQHRRRHTRVKREPKYTPCPQCNEKFTNQGNLFKHVREKHSDHRMFKCEICGKGFHASSGLWFHRRAHHATEKHKCTFCEKTFTLKLYLNKHIRFVHNKCGRMKCPHCPYACENSSLLSQHLNVHFGRKLKKCPHCDSMRPPNVLKKHIEQVHNGKRYKCNLCGGVFNQSRLGGHMLLKHPDVRNPVMSECFTVVFVEPNQGQKQRRLNPSKKLDTGISEVGNINENLTNPTISPPPPKPAAVEVRTTEVTLPNGEMLAVQYKVVDQIKRSTPSLREALKRKTNDLHQITRKQGRCFRPCALCNNHPILLGQAWTVHMAKHERDPTYRINPRHRVKRLVDSADYKHQPTTKECVDVDSSVTDKFKPTSTSEQASESGSGLETEWNQSSAKASASELPCLIPDSDQNVTTVGDTESSPSIEGSATKKAAKKQSIMMFKCPYETCTEPTGDWVPWANLKKHITSSHPEEYTLSGKEKQIRLIVNCSEPQPKPNKKLKVIRNTKISCPQCEKLISARSMSVHLKYVHNKPESKTECPQCGKLLAGNGMRHHILYVHNELQSTPHECKICNKTFQHKLYLENHLKTINHQKLATEKGTVQDANCSEPEPQPKPNKQLNLKAKKVISTAKIPCPQCEKLISARNMRVHLKYVHNKLESKAVCPKCGKLLVGSRMRAHILYVHNELQSTPHECKICNKTFQHKPYLENHLKTINHQKLAAEKGTVQDATNEPGTVATSESLVSDPGP